MPQITLQHGAIDTDLLRHLCFGFNQFPISTQPLVGVRLQQAVVGRHDYATGGKGDNKESKHARLAIREWNAKAKRAYAAGIVTK